MKLLKVFDKQIDEVENEIMKIINANESLKKSYGLLTSINGVGFVNAVNTIIYTDNFSSFDNSRQYAACIGIAPFSRTSGTSVNKRTLVSKMGNKSLKADLSQAAKSAVEHDPQLKFYYNRKLSQGKSKGCVLNAVKFKIVYRMFAVIKRRTAYVQLMKYAS